MKNKLIKVICLTAISCIISTPFAMTAHAESLTDSTEIVSTTKSYSRLDTKIENLRNFKSDLNSKIENEIGNLINLKIGDVGSVDVGTSDDVDVNLNNVNVNVNINFGNIIISNGK